MNKGGNQVIVVAGMIGLGKSTVAELIANALGSEVLFESVDDNPILPLFYTATAEEIEKKRYPFLLQLHFLHTRYASILKALQNKNNVLDRSIYEDWYFAHVNHKLGRINDEEMTVYENLLNSMLVGLTQLPKTSPDLMVYLKGSFEKVMERIQLRGREFELDPELETYYRTLWEGYDDWTQHHYQASEVLVIDMDRIDVRRPEDEKLVVRMVKEKLLEIRKSQEVDFSTLYDYLNVSSHEMLERQLEQQKEPPHPLVEGAMILFNEFFKKSKKYM